MTEVTVKQLADVVGIPVDRLLVQLGEAGLAHRSEEERVNDEDKARLLSHLRRLHGKGDREATAPRKISLKRKSVSELKIPAERGRHARGLAKTVTVEVRKRRTYVRDEEDQTLVSVGKEEATEERARIEAAKRALQEEAKSRQQELGEKLRAEEEAREKEEAQRKAPPPEKPARRAKAEPEMPTEVSQPSPEAELVTPPVELPPSEPDRAADDPLHGRGAALVRPRGDRRSRQGDRAG